MKTSKTAATSSKSDKADTNSSRPTVRVQRQYFQGKEPTSEAMVGTEALEVRQFVTAPANVRIAKGLTLNLGNFESARLDVEITLPCYVEEADMAYTYADKWVESRLAVEVESVRKNKPSLF